ncbi:hypothetical protein [Terriglobus roseus]|uniref:RidA family protein n=1 Tax=Terriglobus roseus TaxID=392734 RepID=A0A1H4IW05_9BACT|nr:hypothetical protein [Terriglobus roseus]SEB38045.1 hypothetical protein SAMN05443244_0122 [Terriglobus roseus]
MDDVTLMKVPDGGFAYVPSRGRAFSTGVVALEGHVLRRVHLQHPLSFEAGFQFAAGSIRAAGRPLNALCGCELRIARRLTRSEFSEFNQRYIAALRTAGFNTEPVNPAARTNVVPFAGTPTDATLTAFTFATPGCARPTGPDFLVSGKPELTGDSDEVIAPSDQSVAGLEAKAAFVLEELQLIVRQLGAQWVNATAVQIYSQHSVGNLKVVSESGLPIAVFTHVPGDPPVFGPGGVPLEFEADVRSVTLEDAL